jgi:hypothetical protein
MNWVNYLATLSISLVLGIAIISQLDAQDITITVTKQKVSENDDSTKKRFEGNRAAVDVAILLDTSNSMDGLISQAKSQLWNIVQEFAAAEKRGQTPILRVSVFEYGNTGLPASEGYIRQVLQLTDDLDKVSEALFGLTTNGGDEYCGMVIDEALTRLDWSNETNAYKAIFIAGNEPFTQGSVDYKLACKRAIESGVVVNTIHCGNYQRGVSGQWKHGAELAEGEYLNIDQDQKVVHIKCPQDKIIIELNKELNKTYLWFGQKGTREKFRMNQAAQDANAASLQGLASRVQTKSSELYRNVGRDLVDTFEADKDLIPSLKDEELPESMQKMSVQQRVEHVKTMANRRNEIRKKLAALNVERNQYIAQERAKMTENSEADTLGSAISKVVRKQLKESGFTTDKK